MSGEPVDLGEGSELGVVLFGPSRLTAVCDTSQGHLDVEPLAPAIDRRPNLWLSSNYGIEQPDDRTFVWHSMGTVAAQRFDSRSATPPNVDRSGRIPRLEFAEQQTLSALWASDDYAGPFGGTAMTVFVAGEFAPQGGADVLLARCRDGNHQLRFRPDTGGGFVLEAVIHQGGETFSESWTLDAAKVSGSHVFALRAVTEANETVLEAFADGVSLGRRTPGPGKILEMTFDQIGGRCGTPGHELTGELMEIMLYSARLDDEELGLVSTYLAEKLTL